MCSRTSSVTGPICRRPSARSSSRRSTRPSTRRARAARASVTSAGGAPADPYARRAVVLGPKEFCILFDADGNPGSSEGRPACSRPHDTFLHRGSRRRVYDAYELSERQALWLRIITPVSRARLAELLPPGYPLDRETYGAGHELLVRGLPSVLFPFIEAEVIHPETREPHVGNDHEAVVLEAVGIDQQSGIYVRDLRTGRVRMVRGEVAYLVDPRYEERVSRHIDREDWSLWTGDNTVTQEQIETPWAISVQIPSNAACEITSREGRRVELGPKSLLLEFEEELTRLRLSKGPSKDGHHAATTCFLRVLGGRFADSFEVEAADLVRLKVRVGLVGHFAGDPARWFAIVDPVKLMADVVRAKVRDACRKHAAAHLLAHMTEVVREAVGALEVADNGMVLDQFDVLAVHLADGSLGELFARAQREAFELKMKDAQARRRLESARLEDLVDAEEHRIVRDAVVRKAESNIVDAEAAGRVTARTLEVKAANDALALDKKQAIERASLEFEAHAASARTLAATERLLVEARAEAQANTARNEVEAVHKKVLAGIESELAEATAKAEAIRLGAVQRELVAALYAAADSEVMKAAASNMNLVSLLGGKSPAELLTQVVKGTPLERTVESWRARTDKTNGA
ncbi:MAG: hypothetical protein U0271_37175 [Polyangiaceae bacterium]